MATSQKTKTGKITDLVFDDKNFNKGSVTGNALIEKSLQQFGAGRSILVDKHNNIIAGNKTAENYGATGGEDILIVETTGDKLVVVKRTDVDLKTKAGRSLALADNAAAKASIVFVEDLIIEELGVDVAEDWKVISPAKGNPFEDDGIAAKNQYAVIVMAKDELEQQTIFERLQADGFTCKIIVT